MAQFYNKHKGIGFYMQYAWNSVGMSEAMNKRTTQIHESGCEITKYVHAIGSSNILRKAKSILAEKGSYVETGQHG